MVKTICDEIARVTSYLWVIGDGELHQEYDVGTDKLGAPRFGIRDCSFWINR